MASGLAAQPEGDALFSQKKEALYSGLVRGIHK